MNVFGFILLNLGFISIIDCYIEPIDIPPEISTCLQAYNSRHNDTSDDLDAHTDCLDQFVWKTGRIRWSDYNVTQEDLAFLRSLSRSFVHEHRRFRRTVSSPYGPMGLYPTTGFRIRREIRRLTDRERSEFFKTMNILKTTGTYDLFAVVHRGVIIQSAHFGPNFMSWHRIYCPLFEEALRRVNPHVSLPYWDTTLDYALPEPVFSIIWTPSFFGNGDGYLTTGAFAGWRNVNGDPIARNINGDGILMSTEVVLALMSRCRNSEITYPRAKPHFNFDLIHGGVHRWMGGQMSGLQTAAAEPAFFLYHCFIDYLWEQFRIKQARVCGINPSTDIAPATGLQNPKRRMDAFSFYRNSDGYSGFWSSAWYRYELSPTCGPRRPSCGSPYLQCSPKRGQCISAIAPPVKGFVHGYRSGSSPTAFRQTVFRSEAEVRSVFIGEVFPTPTPDPRTAVRRFGRRPVTGRKRRDVSGLSKVPEVKVDITIPEGSVVFDKRSSAEILPAATEVWDQRSGSTLRPPVDNSFVIDGKMDESAWVYMPVKVVTFGSEFARQYLNKTVKNYENVASCSSEVSGASQITLQSQGLTYAGVFEELVLVDSKLPVSSSITYIAVKDPRDQASEVLITATDSCKRLCEPKCLISSGNHPDYKTCDGAIKLSNQPPLMYGKTVEEVAAKIWTWTGSNFEGPSELPLVFFCS